MDGQSPKDQALGTPASTAEKAAANLLARLDDGGFWPGRLSSSALATGLAIFALESAGGKAFSTAVDEGEAWLLRHRNRDGGWGDSPESPSNRTTTLICHSVLKALASRSSTATATGEARTACLAQAERWLLDRFHSLSPTAIREGVLSDYGNDKTFSVPILTLLALTGRVPWRQVPQLPFELAVPPQALFRWLRLPVVSYALPALIAMGLARHRRRPTAFLPWRWLRNLCAKPALARLHGIQPSNGGFLEAPPLVAFVLMSLIAADAGDSTVAGKCVEFLRSAQRGDGSWPIDTHLATWLTSLSLDALTESGCPIPDHACDTIESYLLAAQFRERHPYTGAAAGGWAWTHLPGGVPDADDTAGALVALRQLQRGEKRVARDTLAAAEAGIRWLMAMQNRDGGIPTFCRGWGKLPFDRSCPDITAHALRAFDQWRDQLPHLKIKIASATDRGLVYLRDAQRADGAWLPLWFGNQYGSSQENPVYGTAQVVVALARLQTNQACRAPLIATGVNFLRGVQNADGGWGGQHGAPSSVEETALVIRALRHQAPKDPQVKPARQWLARQTHGGERFPVAPIGLYFSSLWYAEDLYPLIHAAASGS